jgi:hypothetical protein
MMPTFGALRSAETLKGAGADDPSGNGRRMAASDHHRSGGKLHDQYLA